MPIENKLGHNYTAARIEKDLLKKLDPELLGIFGSSKESTGGFARALASELATAIAESEAEVSKQREEVAELLRHSSEELIKLTRANNNQSAIETALASHLELALLDVRRLEGQIEFNLRTE